MAPRHPGTLAPFVKWPFHSGGLYRDRAATCYDPRVLRKAFRMAIHPGHAEEYARRHQPIWSELEATLIAHGVRTYSIFLDPETHDLFGYVEVDDDARWNAIAGTDVCRRWWRYMRELMPVNPDDSPISRELREVFHVER
jgi:L-rhamnose mutarotase